MRICGGDAEGAWVGGMSVVTGSAVRLGEEARKGFRLAATLAPGWCR